MFGFYLKLYDTGYYMPVMNNVLSFHIAYLKYWRANVYVVTSTFIQSVNLEVISNLLSAVYTSIKLKKKLKCHQKYGLLTGTCSYTLLYTIRNFLDF